MAEPPASRSFAFDLEGTDLRDHTSLTELVVAHTIAPVRFWCGLPPPQPGEDRDYLIERKERGSNGVDVQYMRSWHLDESPRAFDPLIRALFLFARLFPQCVGLAGSVDETLRHPGIAVLADSMHLVGRSYDAIADLVAGLLGVPSVTPWNPGDYHAKARNDDALAELEEARQIVRRVTTRGEIDGHTRFIDIGLQRLDYGAAMRLDEILRRDVHRRLVWFTTFEVYDEGDDDAGPSSTEWFERGIFGAQVPETIAGLVALDYTEQLRLGNSIAQCAYCQRLMAVEGRQRYLVTRGRPVYHEACYGAHKREYWRAYQRARSRARPTDPFE